MAAPAVVQSGIDFVFKYGGTAIGGRRGGTINLTSDVEDVTNADSALWRKALATTRAWSIDFDGLYLEASEEIKGYGATLAVGANDLKGVRSLTLSGSMETIDTTNQDSAEARSILPTTRSVSITIEADYLDPAGANGLALSALLIAKEAGDPIAVTLAFGATTTDLAADVLVTDVSISAPYNDRTTVSITLEIIDEPTETFTTPDTGFGLLMTAFFAATPTTVAGIIDTVTVGATKFTGTGYITSFEIAIPHDGAVSVSGSLTGSGAVVQGLTSA